MKSNIMLYNSIIGNIYCRLEDDYLTGLSIGSNNFENFNEKIVCTELKKELDDYFSGLLFQFKFPIKFSSGTDFQKYVWTSLLKIPYGEIISYKALANAIGYEKGFQAVGNAVGKNPILIIIPCHRVVGADGSLRGFASGIKRKNWLINHERRFRLTTNFRHWFK
ncbi:MAG TPA: methylated-DNA--[protein]-cysteine S-methyltransferase [Nitrospirae bacterium]|nr:methylated-DNA--[protein]-cysteine S-methyltransferase [Nitrospirota bacterium]